MSPALAHKIERYWRFQFPATPAEFMLHAAT